jgi:lipopolysaccharide/colanic/teichoic acid biosynthesis glycosyltransferase
MIRVLDVLFSLLGMLFGLPVFLVVIILSLLDHGSPFFKQSRVGKNQQLFTLVKFRTMAIGTQSVGTHLVDPSSITKLGRFLRKTKLDELPQLFNVFVGEMSLVEPGWPQALPAEPDGTGTGKIEARRIRRSSRNNRSSTDQ